VAPIAHRLQTSSFCTEPSSRLPGGELHQVLSEHRWTSKRSVQADGGHPVPPTEQADDERGHAQLAAHVR